VFSSFFSSDDEYYSSLSRKDAVGLLATDPVNNITKRLYDETETERLFPSALDVVHYIKYRFYDIVYDRPYRRSLFVFLLQKS